MTMRSELGESPEVVERLLGEGAGEIAAVANAMRERQVDVAVVAARGTSDHAAIYAQYILGARNRLLVAPSAPSLYALYGAPPVTGGNLSLPISAGSLTSAFVRVCGPTKSLKGGEPAARGLVGSEIVLGTVAGLGLPAPTRGAGAPWRLPRTPKGANQ